MNATTDFLKSQIVIKDERIAQLEQFLASTEQRSRGNANLLITLRESMQQWTMNAVSQRLISESDAEEISAIVGFDLTTEVTATVTVEYEITMQVPFGEDAESMVNDIDFETVQYNEDNITWLSASVDRVDIS
jgi:hypothetical protein